MTSFICITCGTQFAESAAPQASCPICLDDRQFVGWDGQSWTTLDDLRRSHKLRFEAEDDGVTGISIEPHFAIGQRALLVQTQSGNVLWDCVALIDEDAVRKIQALGGLSAIAISHPHFYTVLGEWSEAFGGVPVYLHEDDRQWVMRPHRSIVHWNGNTHRIAPGLTLIRCGGHFPGSTVMHSAESAGGRGALFSGDTIMVAQDRKSVSFMHSFPNFIPLNAASVRRVAAAVAPYRFGKIFSGFGRRNVMREGEAVLERSVARYLEAIA
jgi:hypothetical protein